MKQLSLSVHNPSRYNSNHNDTERIETNSHPIESPIISVFSFWIVGTLRICSSYRVIGPIHYYSFWLRIHASHMKFLRLFRLRLYFYLFEVSIKLLYALDLCLVPYKRISGQFPSPWGQTNIFENLLLNRFRSKIIIIHRNGHPLPHFNKRFSLIAESFPFQRENKCKRTGFGWNDSTTTFFSPVTRDTQLHWVCGDISGKNSSIYIPRTFHHSEYPHWQVLV